ncbi:hypothetical protein D3C81_495070 [compost metagenome]
MRGSLGHRHLQLRRRHHFRQFGQHLVRCFFALGQYLQQARGGVQAIVEAEPAFLEEEVAAHLARQFGVGLAHLRLHQRVPGLPHQRAAAIAQHVIGQLAGALHVVDHHRARIAHQHVGGEQHQQTVGVDDLAFARDHAEAIAITIERNAEIGAEALDRLHQVFQVGRFAGIGVVVGEGAVDIAVQRNDFGADRFQQLRREGTGHAVARIGDHLQRAVQLHVIGNTLDVISADLALLVVTRFRRLHEAAFDNALVKVGDRIAGQGLTTDDDLETVVVRRIVAAGNRYAGTGAQMVGGEIHDRGRSQTDIDHRTAGTPQAFGQPRRQFRTGQAAIAADHHLAQALLEGDGADGLADQRGGARRQFAADHAADVIGTEDARSQFLGGNRWRRRRRSLGHRLAGYRRRDHLQAFTQGRAVIGVGHRAAPAGQRQ